jgi:hypothetical protein
MNFGPTFEVYFRVAMTLMVNTGEEKTLWTSGLTQGVLGQQY